MNDIVQPQFKKDAFTCPFCNVYAKFEWSELFILNKHNDPQWVQRNESRCQHCGDACVWDYYSEKLIYPTGSVTYKPHQDMPDEIKVDFEEAALIFQYSPRSAAALLRLALQKLCIHLGGKGNINKDIRYFSEHDILPKAYIKMADTVRLTGNEALHPGEMNDLDVDFVTDKLFLFLNNIVIKGITEPKEVEEFYNMTPEPKRQYAEEADAKAKAK